MLASRFYVCYKISPMAKAKTKKKVSKTTKTKSAPKTTKKTIAKSSKPNKEVEIKETTPQKNTKSASISEQLKLGESYVSLVLGAVVVFGASMLLFLIIIGARSTNTTNPNTQIKPETTKDVIGEQTKNNTYVLQDGESLWDVAVKFYGDGYRYEEIIKANNFPDPDNVPPGTKIIIPANN